MAATSLRDLAALFRAELVLAQVDRDKRPNLVTIGGETEPGWVFHERRVMHRETNWAREQAGFEPVPVEAIKRAEQSACGHVDYTAKYAFHCAEIALGCSPIWKNDTPVLVKEN